MEVYEKRRQIRDILRSGDQNAFFSEELSLTDELGNMIPCDVAEVLQSEYSDLVINIADSTGSLMEAQQFSQVLGDRCLLWLRQGTSGYQTGLAQSLASIGRPPLYFDSQDLKSCVVAKASEDWVYAMRMRELQANILEKRAIELKVKRRR